MPPKPNLYFIVWHCSERKIADQQAGNASQIRRNLSLQIAIFGTWLRRMTKYKSVKSRLGQDTSEDLRKEEDRYTCEHKSERWGHFD